MDQKWVVFWQLGTCIGLMDDLASTGKRMNRAATLQDGPEEQGTKVEVGCPLWNRSTLLSRVVLVPRLDKTQEGMSMLPGNFLWAKLWGCWPWRSGKCPQQRSVCLQNSCGMKTPQNKVLVLLTPNQLQVPKGLLLYHSLSYFSVSCKIYSSQIYFC